ncbi:MAG: hypothetical protein ACR2OZ_14045 [Verrucomicrobiales bacterium]
MLIKLLSIVSAIVLAAGAFFAIQNRAKFKQTRLEKNRINQEEVKPGIARYEERLTQIEQEIAILRDAKASRDQKQIALVGAEANLTAKTSELADIAKAIAETMSKRSRLESELPDVSIDELQQTIERLTQEIAALKTEAETQTKELQIVANSAKERQKDLGVLQRSATQRNKGIALNSMQAVITAVNPDYGFAVVNAGENRGVTQDSKFIVKRGSQRIGLLNAASIQRNRTVADIVPESLTPGYSIAPGDQVIIEKVQR